MINASFLLTTGFAVQAAMAATCKPRSGFNETDLRSRLSSGAEVYLPGSSDFNATTARWSSLDAPQPNVVVVPAVENDVALTVQYANEQGLPFLAANGVHGSITTLGQLQGGIEIYLSGLSSIDIAADGATVTVGGGVRSKNVTDALWAAGKQTVTGTCECVGYLGPALGGGHGWLQGHHGLVSDQFESVRLVTAAGDLLNVSADAHADLFWGLRGAGHNFGIVTSVTSRIYDLAEPSYALQTLIFSGSLVEDVYATANDLWLTGTNASQPDGFINWSYWFYDTSLDASNVVIAMYLIQEGVDAVDASYVAAFEALGPIVSSPSTGTYRDLAAWTGIDLASTPCQKTGNANTRFPIYFQSYNTTAMSQAYGFFNDAVTAAGSPFTGSLFMAEGYSMAGVQAVADDATAFAYRSDNILAAPLLSYAPNGTALEQRAYSIGTNIRNALWAGSNGGVLGASKDSLHAYVNYAFGDETPASWYGADSWRQSKLRSLKQTYDPNGRFSFYGPIA